MPWRVAVWCAFCNKIVLKLMDLVLNWLDLTQLQVVVWLPALIFKKLRAKDNRTRKDGELVQPSDVRRFGWLFVRYTHGLYWWETFNMYKQTLMVFSGAC